MYAILNSAGVIEVRQDSFGVVPPGAVEVDAETAAGLLEGRSALVDGVVVVVAS